MSRYISRAAARWCPTSATVLLTIVALTVTACGSDDADEAQEIVTVTRTAEDESQAESVAQDEGPDPTGADQAPAPAPDQQSGPELADNTAKIALTGNVVEMTAGELMDGGPTPNGELTSDHYIVLQLSGPQQITAQQSGGPDTREETVTQVSLATPDGSLSSINWNSYVGKQVTVTTTPDGLWFPSDAGMPLGMVRLSEGAVT